MSNLNLNPFSLLTVLILLGAIVIACSQGAPNCSSPLISSNGIYTYNIQDLVGVGVNASVAATGYEITICANNIAKCGLCDSAGFCEIEQWYENCVGKFSGAIPDNLGAGVTLSYPNGEFGRSGTVVLRCDPNAGPIGKTSIQNDGNIALINSSLACPVNSTPPSDLCNQYGSDCYSCLNSNQPCAFCLDTSSCIGVNQTCSDYFKKPELCAKLNNCNSASTCGNCTNLNSQYGCYWCPDLVGSGGTCEQSWQSCSTGKISKGQYCNLK